MKKKQHDNVISLPRREQWKAQWPVSLALARDVPLMRLRRLCNAWEASTSERAIALARKALQVSPDCADAYVLLAQETARSLDDEIDLYRKGVEAGERALGKDAFEEDVGHFWGILETRSYMRARAGLAQCLWEVGQRGEAVRHYQDRRPNTPQDEEKQQLQEQITELQKKLFVAEKTVEVRDMLHAYELQKATVKKNTSQEKKRTSRKR